MKSFFAILSFAVLAVGQITRDPNSASSDGSYQGSRTSAITSASRSATAEQWPQRASTTAAPSVGPGGDAPFTFGDGAASGSGYSRISGAPFTFGNGDPGASTASGSYDSWLPVGTIDPSLRTQSYSSWTPANTVSSAAGITTHAPTFFSTTKAASTSSTKASSAAQATYTGAASVGRQMAYGFGAVAAGLALVF